MLAAPRANLLVSALGILAAIMLVIAVVQTVRIEGFGIWPLKIAGLKAKYGTAVGELKEARAEMERISAAKNEQGRTTGRTIGEAEKGQRDADGRAERIEAAPTAPGCSTPPEIMGAAL